MSRQWSFELSSDFHEEAGGAATKRARMLGRPSAVCAADVLCVRFNACKARRRSGSDYDAPLSLVKSNVIGCDGLMRQKPPLGTCRFGRFLRSRCGLHTPEVPTDGNIVAPPALAP